jgi:hypothetical protein
VIPKFISEPDQYEAVALLIRKGKIVEIPSSSVQVEFEDGGIKIKAIYKCLDVK